MSIEVKKCQKWKIPATWSNDSFFSCNHSTVQNLGNKSIEKDQCRIAENRTDLIISKKWGYRGKNCQKYFTITVGTA